MKWFRFNADAMRHPTVAKLSHVDFRFWIKLLCLAAENDGVIPCSDDVVTMLRERRDAVVRALSRLRVDGLIEAKGDGFVPHNWEKYHPKSMTSANRMRKHRAKSDVTVTPYDNEYDNDTNTSSLRSDKNIIKKTSERFWEVYPKRVNKKAAFARLQTALKAGVDPETIIEGAERYAEHVRAAGTEAQFIKAPDAWLNAGKWDDELPGVGNGGGNKYDWSKEFALLRQIDEEEERKREKGCENRELAGYGRQEGVH